MVSSGKLFLYREPVDYDVIEEKIGKFDYDHGFIDGFKMLTRIRTRRSLDDDTDIYGEYSRDTVISTEYHGEVMQAPMTITTPFIIFLIEDDPYLIALNKKNEANKVANELSVLLHGSIGSFTEPVLNLQQLRQLYENSEATKIVLFDNIDLPNMDKGTLYGSNVYQTDFYGRFINHGTPWYVVFKDMKKALTIGLVRDATIVCFSSVTNAEYLEYVKDSVVPLIARRKTE